MRPCELNDIANLSTAGQGTMSRAGLGGRSVDTSPVQGRATQVPALLDLQGSPAMPCYALLCPASAKSLSEKRREHVRERDRVSWLNPVSHTSSSEDVHTAQGTNAFTALSKESELGTCFLKQENVEQRGLQLDKKFRKKASIIVDRVVHTQLQVW